MKKQNILIVEDEKAIADTLVYALSSENFNSHWVSGGESAIQAIKDNHYDCVLLDIGLPDINGFEVLKSIRSHSDIPVLFLTARSEEIDKILGLEMGADDYITKPFSPREVVARIRVILRRINRTNTAETIKTTTTPVEHFQLNEAAAIITLQQQELSLTKAEYLLLKTFISQPNRVFSRSQLIAAVWDENHPSDERAIDTHVKTLRAKIREIDDKNNYIHTHRGLGYSLQL